MKKVISIVLCLAMVLSLPLPVTAVSGKTTPAGESVVQNSSAQDSALRVSEEAFLRSDDPSIAKDSMILKYVDSARFDAAKHTMRLTELEDLNTYVFANADGTRSVYLMHENVKYIDKNGAVKEKDLSLVQKTKGFGITQSDIGLLLPHDPTQGIDLTYGDYAIKLTPQGLAKATAARKTDNSVVYDQAYGANTKLKYTPLLSGIKEDIVLTQYTKNATLSFILDTDGLNLYNNNNGYYLASSAKGAPVFYLGDIIVYDAIGKPDRGTLTVKTVEAGQKYLLTVSANDSFLSDPKTVYPVTIDPNITVSDETTSGSIIDAPIFEGYPNSNFGNYLYNTMGTPSEDLGIGRTVVKLSGLLSATEYQSITGNQITNVTFYAMEGSGTASQYINLYPLTTNTTWTESSVTWNNVGSYTTMFNYGNTMAYGQFTAFNITELVRSWKNGPYNADCGFIMVNANEANDKCFCSAEFPTTSYQPYVVMTYEYAVNISASPAYMLVGQTKQLSCSTNPSGLSVSWSSNNTSVATVSSSGLVTAISEGTVMITATYTDGLTGSTNSDYEYLYIMDSLGIKDDTKYYIMNYDSLRYLSLESALDENLTNVCTQERSTSNLSQWKTEQQADGTFQLINVYSPTGKALDATGINIDIYTDNGASYQKFFVYRINSGTYRGLYYIRYGNYYVAEDLDYNVYLTTTPSSSAVWSFMAVDIGIANCYSIRQPYTGKYYFDHFEPDMNAMGYTTNSRYCVSAGEAYWALSHTDDVFMYLGHGVLNNETEMLPMAGIGFQTMFGEGEEPDNGKIFANNAQLNEANEYAIDDLDKNALASVRCVLYLGCSTGVTYTEDGKSYNLVESTYNKGAHFVLGTLAPADYDDVCDFSVGFVDMCLDYNYNIEEAIDMISDDFPELCLYCIGDSKQFLKLG